MSRNRNPSRQNQSIQQSQRGRGSTPQVFAQREIYQGELPHPEHLRQYEELAPGITKMLLDERSIERSHRHELEIKQSKRSDRATIFGFLGTLSALLFGLVYLYIIYFALSEGKEEYIGQIIGYPLVAIIGLFITRRLTKFSRKGKSEE